MKTLKYIILAAAAAFVFAACNDKDPKLKGIEFEAMRIPYGYRGAVSAYPKPWNCTDYHFTYKVADESIVTVNELGTLETEWLGSTTITVSSGSYSVDVPVEVYTDIPEEIWSYQIGDMIKDKFSDKLTGLWEFNIKTPMKVAIMGCIVNGPGEARECDFGIAGGKGVGLLFRNGEVIRKVPEEELLAVLVEEAEKYDQ